MNSEREQSGIFRPESERKTSCRVSLVIPVFNEEPNLKMLYEHIDATLRQLGILYEIIFVDDGSRDNSVGVLLELRQKDPAVKILKFRRNFGQTPAMAAGFDYAHGDIIIPLDADMQNDPKDIPRLIEKIAQGYDIVSGWRKNRQDKAFSRKLPSMIANRIIGRLTGVRIHDYGCSLKAYRASVIKAMHLYSDMHRFLPAMGLLTGARVTELAVTHHARKFGKSKYGISRTGKVMLDIMTIKLITHFSSRPLHFFGGGAAFAALAAVLLTGWSAALYLTHTSDQVFALSVPTVAFLAWWLVTSLIGMGILGEFIVKTGQWRSAGLQHVLAQTYEHKVEA